jgi:hypothetical protein
MPLIVTMKYSPKSLGAQCIPKKKKCVSYWRRKLFILKLELNEKDPCCDKR